MIILKSLAQPESVKMTTFPVGGIHKIHAMGVLSSVNVYCDWKDYLYWGDLGGILSEWREKLLCQWHSNSLIEGLEIY